MDIIDFYKWGYKKSDDFTGLMPKLMELLGEQYCVGGSDEVLSIFDPTAKGVDQLKVVSPQLIALSDEGGDTPTPDPEPDPDPEPTPDPEPDPESGDTPTPDPEPQPDHDFTPPTKTENTPEQDQTASSIVDSALNPTGSSSPKIIVPEDETINNLTLPEDTPKFTYITGACQDGATITNNSSKGMTLTITNEEPINIIVEGNGGSTTNIHGNFNDIYASAPISLTSTDKVYGTITFAEDYEGNVNITADFQDGAMVQTLTHGTVTVSNQNGETDIEIYAPNASVVLKGKSDEVTATVADDTLYLDASAHINKLIVKQGNVKVYGLDPSDFIGEFVGEGTVEAMEWNVPDDVAVNKMVNNPGIYTLTADYSGTSVLGFGIFATGKYQYNLNDHSLETTNKNYVMFLRGTATINVYGPGRMANIGEGYGCWVSSTGATLNIYGGEFEGNTHTLYAENGTINVYGGIFKLSNADTAERDEFGNLKFLLNCLDASYTSGAAKINVYGGKFYEFNPAVTYGEPSGPVSYVAEGYHVVESTEDGKKVYEVVKD